MLRIDPETSLGLLLRLGGAGAFLVLAGGIMASLLVVAFGLARGNPRLMRQGGLLGAGLSCVAVIFQRLENQTALARACRASCSRGR